MGKREKLYILLLLTTLFSYFMKKGVSIFFYFCKLCISLPKFCSSYKNIQYLDQLSCEPCDLLLSHVCNMTMEAPRLCSYSELTKHMKRKLPSSHMTFSFIKKKTQFQKSPTRCSQKVIQVLVKRRTIV